MRDDDRPILEKTTSIIYIKKHCVFYKDRIDIFKRGKLLCSIRFSDIYSMQYRSSFSWRYVFYTIGQSRYAIMVDPKHLWVVFDEGICGKAMKKWCFHPTVFNNVDDWEVRARSLILKLTKEEIEILRQHFIVEIEMLK